MNIAKSDTPVMHIRPRYYRLFTDSIVEEAEVNFRYAELDWEIPLSKAAIVCVDIWNYLYTKDGLERTDKVTRQKIAPIVETARKYGLQIIHAPAPPVAPKHQNWVNLLDNWDKPNPQFNNSPVWPPQEFKEKTGIYSKYARPYEPQQKKRNDDCFTVRDFHELIRPENDEPVIVNGEELHRVCAQRGILHLFYVGFHTNMCIVMRDYGVYEMMSEGYNIVLVRDATTGIETHETQADMTCTKGSIATFEQVGGYTVTTDQLISALVDIQFPLGE